MGRPQTQTYFLLRLEKFLITPRVIVQNHSFQFYDQRIGRNYLALVSSNPSLWVLIFGMRMKLVGWVSAPSLN